MLMDITNKDKTLPNRSNIETRRLKTQFQLTLFYIILNDFHLLP